MNEDDVWYDDNDFLISYESLSPFIIEGLVRIDSQVFGLVSSFPYAFICGTIASSLVILIILQITLKTLIVATGSFLAANITAYLFGRRLGRRFEHWHLYLLIEYKKTRITQSTKDNNDKENLITSHQNDIDNENNNQNRIRPILKGRPRNWYFKIDIGSQWILAI
jgi:hypothetical protein